MDQPPPVQPMPPAQYPPYAPPYPPPYGPPPPFYYPPPPKSSNLVVIVVIVVVLIVGVSVATAAVLYFMVSGTLTDNTSPRPAVTFASPTAITDGFAFTVAGASQNLGPGSYRINVEVNSTRGSPVPLAVSMTITIQSRTYSLRWVDIGGERTLSAGDRFEVTTPGGLSPSTFYVFHLLYIDGTTIQRSTYRTP